MKHAFVRTARAIRFLIERSAEHPSLHQVAEHLGVAPEVAQREFRRLAGISPKRLLQHLAVDRSKGLLDRGLDVLQTSLEVGLSGPGRLHDHWVRIEAMTPGEWKRRMAGGVIKWGMGRSAWGTLAVAWTRRGIHRMEFIDRGRDRTSFLNVIGARVRDGSLTRNDPDAQAWIDRIFGACRASINLCLIATPFQASVWRALLAIDDFSTYASLAKHIGNPRAARAVGQAVGANPVALVIPCHRVLRECGALGGYRWGRGRKMGLLAAASREPTDAPGRVEDDRPDGGF